MSKSSRICARLSAWIKTKRLAPEILFVISIFVIGAVNWWLVSLLLLALNQTVLSNYERNLNSQVAQDEAAIAKAKTVQWNGYQMEMESKGMGKRFMMVSVENYSAIQIGDRVCVEYDLYKSQANNFWVCEK